jgi:hypothetical protein
LLRRLSADNKLLQFAHDADADEPSASASSSFQRRTFTRAP